jgi:hypothetical protein
MRLVIAIATLALGFFRAPAIQTPAAAQPPQAPSAHPDSAAQLAQQLAQARPSAPVALPDADHFTWGNRTIAAGTAVTGPVAVARGNVDVYGTVNGDVIAVDGNVYVHRGAVIAGDAWSAAGSVVVDGGYVAGAMRVLGGARGPAIAVATRPPLTTWQAVKLVIGWFALLAILGFGVTIFAEGNLDGVVVALERGFARSFWIGIAGQLLMLPALAVIIAALALTILGALLIPFAIVSYIIAAAGLVTLGFLAVSRLTGGALARGRGTDARPAHVRALLVGLVIYLGIWMIAAAFTWSPVAAGLLRACAIVITWVAATVGLGAALGSRAGTQRAAATARAGDELDWQTPTPVAGVAAAARRPVAGAQR